MGSQIWTQIWNRFQYVVHRERMKHRERKRDLLCLTTFKTWDQKKSLMSLLDTSAISGTLIKFIANLKEETS